MSHVGQGPRVLRARGGAARTAFVDLDRGANVAVKTVEMQRWIRSATPSASAGTPSAVGSAALPPQNARPDARAAPPKPDASKIRHEWYQTQTHVVVSPRGVSPRCAWLRRRLRRRLNQARRLLRVPALAPTLPEDCATQVERRRREARAQAEEGGARKVGGARGRRRRRPRELQLPRRRPPPPRRRRRRRRRRMRTRRRARKCTPARRATGTRSTPT